MTEPQQPERRLRFYVNSGSQRVCVRGASADGQNIPELDRLMEHADAVARLIEILPLLEQCVRRYGIHMAAPPQPDKPGATYSVEAVTDVSGNVLSVERYMFSRIHNPGETYIREYKEYRVLKSAITRGRHGGSLIEHVVEMIADRTPQPDKPLSVEEARAKGVCQYCRRGAYSISDVLMSVYDGKSVLAHLACLAREQAAASAPATAERDEPSIRRFRRDNGAGGSALDPKVSYVEEVRFGPEPKDFDHYTIYKDGRREKHNLWIDLSPSLHWYQEPEGVDWSKELQPAAERREPAVPVRIFHRDKPFDTRAYLWDGKAWQPGSYADKTLATFLARDGLHEIANWSNAAEPSRPASETRAVRVFTDKETKKLVIEVGTWTELTDSTADAIRKPEPSAESEQMTTGGRQVVESWARENASLKQQRAAAQAEIDRLNTIIKTNDSLAKIYAIAQERDKAKADLRAAQEYAETLKHERNDRQSRLEVSRTEKVNWQCTAERLRKGILPPCGKDWIVPPEAIKEFDTRVEALRSGSPPVAGPDERDARIAALCEAIGKLPKPEEPKFGKRTWDYLFQTVRNAITACQGAAQPDSPRAKEIAERLKERRCEACGANLIDGCPRCGAPQCCPQCCIISTMELNETILKERLAKAEAAATKMREAILFAQANSYLDDDVINRHPFTTVSCKALKELFALAAEQPKESEVGK